MPSKIKVQAKDVSEAIAKGLKELGLRRDQVEVTVLETPKKGFLGIGSRPAVVELRQKRWSSSNLDAQIYMDVPKKRPAKSRGGRNGRKDRGEGRNSRRTSRRTEHTLDVREPREKAPKANEPQMLPCEAIRNAVIPENLKAPMAEAKEYLEKVLTQMGVKVENLNVWWDEKQQRILLTFDCDHPAIVIGKEGKTLEAIQYLSTLALSRHFDKPISVITDTQNYWRKAEDKIDAEIQKGIDMIKRGNSVFRFRPMSAQLRRYIHRAVEGNEFVTTASEGEGKWRKVTLRPTEKALEAARANTAPADFVPGVIGEDIPETPAETAEQTPCAEEHCSCCETHE
ncbi:MAG: Jag N-terminal domain-containing protein, partial [Elusimicrobia bacterium]|nr:Jag N-terminal domain-containing protein [Elusimicrobiota bacterium]